MPINAQASAKGRRGGKVALALCSNSWYDPAVDKRYIRLPRIADVIVGTTEYLRYLIGDQLRKWYKFRGGER
jgi:hypothetical protein